MIMTMCLLFRSSPTCVQYLKGLLITQSKIFEVNSGYYQHAVDALKHRFGRKRIIISSLVKSIVQLEPRLNKGVESLRDLHDTLKKRIRALEALGEKSMTHSCILLPILETKLPPELSEKWVTSRKKVLILNYS